MPVIVNSDAIHPFLPSLGSPQAMSRERAEHQDIRPLEIAIINLMADKQATERQLAQWLGNTMLQVKLTFAATDSYVNGVKAGKETKNTPASHIREFYNAWSDIRHRKFDGLIVTGTNALKPNLTDEDIWPEVQEILGWSTTNVLSSLFLCWGAKAALKYFHDIDSRKGAQKLWGVFPHRIVADSIGILSGFPDMFDVPVSRWKSPQKADILKHAELEIVAESNDSGPNILVESSAYGDSKQRYPHRIYVLNHPEYDTDTLQKEYLRDQSVNTSGVQPLNYFPGNDPNAPPVNTWRHTAHLYTNWIRAVYEATPYEIDQIPRAYK